MAMPDRSTGDDDRRRSPRFACRGIAKISYLPSDGIFLQGNIRDLSLHGCCVDTSLPIDYGVRAEIVVRVKAASFRALGEVRAIRGAYGAGLEFVQLSAGGKELLEDLVTDLEKLHAVMQQLKSDRHETDTKSFRKQLEDGKQRALQLTAQPVRWRTLLPSPDLELGPSPREMLEGKPFDASGDRIRDDKRVVITVDLFG